MKNHTPANLPTEPGTYVARAFGKKEFTLLVRIWGAAPYLQGEVWDVNAGTLLPLNVDTIGEFANRIAGPGPLARVPDAEDRWKNAYIADGTILKAPDNAVCRGEN